MPGTTRRRLRGVVGVAGVLVLWEIAAQRQLINTLLLSSPSRVVQSAVQEVQDPVFWQNVLASANEYLFGVALAALVGIAVGVLAGMFRRLNYLTDPWLTILYSMPMIAIVPLLIVAFGIDLAAKVAIIFLFSVFPIIVNTREGVHAASNRYLRIARSFSASRWRILRTVILPGAVPYIMTGLRVAGGRALVGVVAAEFIAADAGIGFQLTVASQGLRTGTVWFLILIIGLSGIGWTVLLDAMEARIERWRPVPVGR